MSIPTDIELIRALRKSGRAAEAKALIPRLVDALPPDLYIGQLGIDMSYLGMYAEAERLLRRSLLDSHVPVHRYMLAVELSIALFLQGKYHEAHALFKALRDTPNRQEVLEVIFDGAPSLVDSLACKFLGTHEPVAGKRILIIIEGGFGDVVHYSRYVDSLLREGAAEVTIEVFEEWRDVIRPHERVRLSLGYNNVRGAEIERCDRVTFVFDLFARYQTSPYFPAANPGAFIALETDKALPPQALALLQTSDKPLKVGLIWRSASTARHEPYRSIQLPPLTPLLSVPNCRFYSLQVGAPSDDERAIMSAHGVIDLAPFLQTFGDTGRVLEQLDLLIAVDTGSAHLAAALNRPVWTLLAEVCDCRWLDCQRFTPWYPSMRLYRQTELGDWSQALADVQADLAQLAQAKH